MNSSPPENRNDTHLANDGTANEVGIDEVAIIFSFLLPKEIMRARVCTTWRDAAKKTIVPMTKFVVDSVRSFNAMRAMSTALPHLQPLSICMTKVYSDREDGNAAIAARANIANGTM
eukprot:scaffold26653_cov153-Skeletonema_menzelii.AAC.4